MTITLIDASEIVTGLVVTGKISPNSVQSDLLFSPYNDVVRSYKDGLIEPEDLILKHGLEPINACLDAIKSLNGLSNSDWLSILESTHMRWNMGVRMEKLGKKLQRGDDVDEVEIRHIANQFGKGKTGRVPLSEVTNTDIPFIKTGCKAIDKHLGGFPSVGLIVVGGESGVGKTTFARDVTKNFVAMHKTKVVAFYSLEMMLPEIAGRFREPTRSDDELEKRILLNADPLSAEQIVADASEIDNLGLILIDFADMMVKGEISEGKMSEIYLTFALAAKQLSCPIILFCQFNKTYMGGIPRPSHIRWTSMAKVLAWMQLMLYRPAEDTHAEKDAEKLPIISDIGYIIAWKIRGGFRKHKDESPGAIQLPFDGETGWNMELGKWFSLKTA